MGYTQKRISSDSTDDGITRAAHARRVLGDCVQHRLDVSGRAGNDPQNFARRSLLFKRFLELSEQPHVLKCDHCLVSEGFEKGNLLVAERTDLSAANHDSSDRNSLAQHRCGEYGPGTSALLEVLGVWEFGFDLCGDIMDVDRLTVGNGPAMHYPTARRYLLPQPNSQRNRPHMGDQPQGGPIKAVDYSIRRLTQPCGTFYHRIEHRLDIGRRTGDHAQDLTHRRLLLQRLLELVEQPHVLKCDHCLVGKSFEQLDLRSGEGSHLGATCGERSNEFPLLAKRNRQVSTPTDVRTHQWEFVLRADVGNVERAMLAHPAKPW